MKCCGKHNSKGEWLGLALSGHALDTGQFGFGMYFIGWVTVGMGWLLASGVLGLACRIDKGLGF